jgi:tetratricopeptide (TPR) repeat protein
LDAERQSWGERAEREARAALALDPELAEAHVALADYYGLTEFHWDRTIDEARRALELNPALERPHFALAGAYLHTGLLDLVEPETNAVAELNPLDGSGRVYGAIASLWSHRYADAVQIFQQTRERAGANPFLDWHLATALFYAGDRPRAEELLANAKREDEPDIRAQAALASFIAARGDRAGAEELMKKATSRPSFEHHAMYSIAQAHAQLGQPAEAVNLLRKARDTGFLCYPFYEKDPLLSPLAANPEFRAFMEEFRKSWEAFRARYGGSG